MNNYGRLQYQDDGNENEDGVDEYTSNLLKRYIEHEDHNTLIFMLSTPYLFKKCNINSAFNFGFARMTGLEYAVMYNDWRMALIFFAFRANPKYNCFGGALQTMGSVCGYEHPIILDIWTEGRPIPGFPGLHALSKTSPSFCEMTASCVRLMEIYENKQVNIQKGFSDLIGDLKMLNKYHGRKNYRFHCKYILLCMKRLDVPNEVALAVVEDYLLGTILDVIIRCALGSKDVTKLEGLL